MSDHVPKRRWFRFGLRATFVVVTVVSVWLGHQANIVRQRRAFLQQHVYWFGEHHIPGLPEPKIPFYRRWLGDEAVGRMAPRLEKDVAQAEALFPESLVWWIPPHFKLSDWVDDPVNNPRPD